MAKARWFIPAIFFLACGLILLLEPEFTGLASLESMPGGTTTAYVICIGLGLLLGVQAFGRLYDEAPKEIYGNARSLEQMRKQKARDGGLEPTPSRLGIELEDVEEKKMVVEDDWIAEQNAKDGFITLGNVTGGNKSSRIDTNGEITVMPYGMTRKDDIEKLRDILREGRRVVLVDISKVRHIPDLKEWFRQLQNTVKAQGGSICGLDKKHVLVISGTKVKR